jgi:hypothetical protein
VTALRLVQLRLLQCGLLLHVVERLRAGAPLSELRFNKLCVHCVIHPDTAGSRP